MLRVAKSDPPATGPSSDKKRTHYIQEQPEQEDNSSGDEYILNAIDDEHSPPFTVTLHINNAPVQMEVNTSAAVSIINEATFQRLAVLMCPHPGTSQQQDEDFTIRYKSTQLYLAVHVVSGTGPNLLGRDQLLHLGWT